MPTAGRPPMGVPALRMRQGQPPREVREVAIAARPEDEVPVIGHHAPREDPHPGPLAGFPQNLEERLIIALVLEDRHPRVRARARLASGRCAADRRRRERASRPDR